MRNFAKCKGQLEGQSFEIVRASEHENVIQIPDSAFSPGRPVSTLQRLGPYGHRILACSTTIFDTPGEFTIFDLQFTRPLSAGMLIRLRSAYGGQDGGQVGAACCGIEEFAINEFSSSENLRITRSYLSDFGERFGLQATERQITIFPHIAGAVALLTRLAGLCW